MGHGLKEHDTMMSVRQMPWHGLGVILDDYPDDIDEALERSGLTWAVNQGDVFVALPADPQKPDYVPQLESNLVPAKDFRANVREDTGEILGIVSGDYKVVPNRDAFLWLDTLLGGDVEIETAGSLGNGRRVWVLAKIPETVEVGGDETQTFVYCANSHDGSMAVTAAATKIRIVCANTLGWALRETEGSERTYRFRHTGDMAAKLDEARWVMRITLDWDAAFKRMGDKLARENMPPRRFDTRVVKPLIGFDEPDLGKIAKQNRENTREVLMNIFQGAGPEGDTTGNSPGTSWAAVNAVAEWADYGRRYTKRTDQVQRSFEDQDLKQRGLDLVLAA